MHQQKVDTAIKLLIEKGVKSGEAYPIFHRLLRKVGIVLRPPLFSRPVNWGASIGVVFALLFNVLMNGYYHIVGDKMEVGVVATICVGIIYGVFMTIYFKRKVKKLQLPDWDDIPTPIVE